VTHFERYHSSSPTASDPRLGVRKERCPSRSSVSPNIGCRLSVKSLCPRRHQRCEGLARMRLCNENIYRPDQIDLVESDRIACAVVELRPLRL
jgi:hypothetical protein